VRCREGSGAATRERRQGLYYNGNVMKPKPVQLTSAEYLDWESKSPVKHEYVDGEIYAMYGATRRHNLIASNLIERARAAGRRRGCQVFGSDMKVHVEARNSFYYPDLSVCCDPSDRHEFFLVRPCFIVEILSPSTAAIDRREKRVSYSTLTSLREYAIVDQRRMRVELYRRESDDRQGKAAWRGYLLSMPDDVVESSCLNLRLSLMEIYEGVELPSGIAEPDPPEYAVEVELSEA
jgi:Uma2 family endonuclease